MSLIPMFFNDWWSDIDRPVRLHDQHFGMGLRPEELMSRFWDDDWMTGRPQMCRRRQEALRRPQGGDAVRRGHSTVECGKDKFKVSLDVQHFKPSEISVKTHDGALLVEGKHEEKGDEHGSVYRHFVRKYAIPPGVQIEQFSSNYSSDGVLVVQAPRMAIEDKSSEPKPVPMTVDETPAVQQ